MTKSSYDCDCCCENYHNGYYHLCPHSSGYVGYGYSQYGCNCRPGRYCHKCKSKPHCKPNHKPKPDCEPKPDCYPDDPHSHIHDNDCEHKHGHKHDNDCGYKPDKHSCGCKPDKQDCHKPDHKDNCDYKKQSCYKPCQCYACKPKKLIPCACSKCKCYGGCLKKGNHIHCIYIKAVANIEPCDPENIDVHGVINFEEYPCGRIRIYGKVYGLAPGKHGVAIYESGNVTDDCSDLGGHYNPFKRNHGDKTAKERHVGDLGNIEADMNGTAEIDCFDCVISLRGNFSVIGRALVIHEGEDDLGLGGNSESLISGNAGERFAFGVISIK